MELVTQAVPGTHASETGLRTNVGCTRALWKRDSTFMSSVGDSLVFHLAMLTIFLTHMTRVAKPLKHC